MTARAGRIRARISIALISWMATAMRSTNAMPGRRAACCMCMDSAGRGRCGSLPGADAEGRKGPIHFTAKLNHRKFSWYYTHFAYAGKPKPGQAIAAAHVTHNSLEYSFDPTNIPANVSGEIEGQIPGSADRRAGAKPKLRLPVARSAPKWHAVARPKTRERWNDWGIGLLLQGDLKGAEYAFRKSTEAEPGYADALAECGARTDSGRRNGRGQAVYPARRCRSIRRLGAFIISGR